MIDDDEFLREIQETFLYEAQDMLVKVEELSLSLEKDGNKEEIFSDLARIAHNLKGSGTAVGLDKISTFAHKIEDFILAIKDKKIAGNSKQLDLLFFCLDTLKNGVEILINNTNAQLDYTKIYQAIDKTLNIQSKKINVIPTQHVSKEQGKEKVISEKKNSNEIIRISKQKLDHLLDSLGEQVLLQSMLDRYKFEIDNKQEFFQKTISQLNKQTIELQKQVLALTTVTFDMLFVKLERAIRDASKICNKKVNVHFSGESTEADKSLIESLADPLIHMVRNAVDHGLETSEERLLSQKSFEGNVTIDVKRVGGQIWIDISDDGKGLDPNFILQKSIEKKIITPEQGKILKDEEIYKLIFSNGFSTKEATTEISGRGVGMNVVLERIESFKGTIKIKSQIGVGTTFRLKLPLSLAIFNGAVIKVNDSSFVVPNSDIYEIVQNNESNLVLLNHNRYGLKVRDQIFEIFNLKKILSKSKSNDNSKGTMFILTNKGGPKAFQIDEVLGIQKIVLKPLQEELKSRSEFVASTILNDGSPSIILSLSEFKQAG